jgi:GDP-L-fucose synthase
VDLNARIYVAGGETLVGRALRKRLVERGFSGVVSDADPDLGDRGAVAAFFERTRPEFIFLTAGKVSGIAGNQQRPADLMTDNLLTVTNVIPAAWASHARKLFYLASSCVYPKAAPQPFHVASIGTGPMEPTSEAYAVAKLAGIKLCQAYRRQHDAAFISGISGDAYGPGDDFSIENAHVAAGLLRRIHEARNEGRRFVEIWGSGKPRREFIYVDDLADACIFAMRHYDQPEPLNLGSGEELSIADLAQMIKEIVGYTGELRFDVSKPDGMPFKALDSTALRDMGWKPSWSLRSGLEETYRWLKTAMRTSARL